MDFILIQPDGLRAVWTEVRAGLEKIPRDSWIPEDVYHAIKSGDAALYLAVKDNGYAGFFVLRRLLDEFTKEPELHCWAGYNHGEHDVYESAIDFMKQLAIQGGMKRLTIASTRPGWRKRFPRVSSCYEIPLGGE